MRKSGVVTGACELTIVSFIFEDGFLGCLGGKIEAGDEAVLEVEMDQRGERRKREGGGGSQTLSPVDIVVPYTSTSKARRWFVSPGRGNRWRGVDVSPRRSQPWILLDWREVAYTMCGCIGLNLIWFFKRYLML